MEQNTHPHSGQKKDPIFRLDTSLDQLAVKVLSPKKLETANQLLMGVKLP